MVRLRAPPHLQRKINFSQDLIQFSSLKRRARNKQRIFARYKRKERSKPYKSSSFGFFISPFRLPCLPPSNFSQDPKILSSPINGLGHSLEKEGETKNQTISFKHKPSQMGASLLQALLLLYLLRVAATEEEWRSATATYTKETNGSIIIEGACGYGDLHKATYGLYSAGLSTMLFNRGSTCGACFELRCVDHILWCLQGSPSVTLTATDFCPPNYGLSSDYGGWCNFPRQHFEMSEAAFAQIAERKADIIPGIFLLYAGILSGSHAFSFKS